MNSVQYVINGTDNPVSESVGPLDTGKMNQNLLRIKKAEKNDAFEKAQHIFDHN